MEPAFLKETRLECVECGKTVLDSDDFTEIPTFKGPLHPSGMVRIHRECKWKKDEREEQFKRKCREERERQNQEFDEQEHSLRPKKCHLYLSKDYYGLKKDFEAFEKEANEIIEVLAKKHNLTTEKKE